MHVIFTEMEGCSDDWASKICFFTVQPMTKEHVGACTISYISVITPKACGEDMQGNRQHITIAVGRMVTDVLVAAEIALSARTVPFDTWSH